MMKKLVLGAAAGLAVSLGMNYLGPRTGLAPIQQAEIGQRGGAIAASHFGGTIGQIGFQVGDALLDRHLSKSTATRPAGLISGMAGVGYL